MKKYLKDVHTNNTALQNNYCLGFMCVYQIHIVLKNLCKKKEVVKKCIKFQIKIAEIHQLMPIIQLLQQNIHKVRS
jgi:hypothetical protein